MSRRTSKKRRASDGSDSDGSVSKTRRVSVPTGDKNRGYLAKFNWQEHYPWPAEGVELVDQTPLVPSIPTIFYQLLKVLNDVEWKARQREILCKLDRKLIKRQDFSRSNPKLIIHDHASPPEEWVVNACRKEHVKLIYGGFGGGILHQLGLCPLLVEVYFTAPGSRLQCVGGGPHDSELQCQCAALKAATVENGAAETDGQATKSESGASAAAAAAAQAADDSQVQHKDDESGDVKMEDVDSAPAAANASAPSSSAASPTPPANGVSGSNGASRSGSEDSGSRRHGKEEADEEDDEDGDVDMGGSGRRTPKRSSRRKKGVQGGRRRRRSRSPSPVEGNLDLEAEDEDRIEQARTASDWWSEIEEKVRVGRRAVERIHRQNMREKNRDIEYLKNEVRNAQEQANRWERRYNAERDNNTKLWQKVTDLSKTVQKMVEAAATSSGADGSSS